VTLITNFLWVACGGAIGASARYGLMLGMSPLTKTFPFATLTANIVGSFLLGWLVLSQAQSESSTGYLFLGVGMLGAFTTFSTFSLDVVLMIQQGFWLKALLYVFLNLGVCCAAVAAAFAVFK